jgi:hypothetical protein
MHAVRFSSCEKHRNFLEYLIRYPLHGRLLYLLPLHCIRVRADRRNSKIRRKAGSDDTRLIAAKLFDFVLMHVPHIKTINGKTKAEKRTVRL